MEVWVSIQLTSNFLYNKYIHTYKDIYKAPFDQKDTKHYEETERQKKKDKSQKEGKGNQLIVTRSRGMSHIGNIQFWVFNINHLPV